MKRQTKMRIWAWLLTVCLCLGMLPADMFGGIATVSAAETVTTDNSATCTQTEWDETGKRTTTWDFSGCTALTDSVTLSDTFLGLTIAGSKVSLKNAGQISLKDAGAIELPIDAAATKVDVVITPSGLTTGRSLKVGNDTTYDNLVCGTDINSNVELTKTYTADGGYWTSAPSIKVMAGDSVTSSSGSVSNEIKLVKIALVEYKDVSGESGGNTGEGGAGGDDEGGSTTENDYTDYYNFKDGSIIPTDTPGNVTVTSGKMTVACGPSNAYAYNGDHGVQFKTGNTITLAVLGDTTIEVGKCTYSQGTISLTKEDGTVIVAAQSMNGSCAKADETSVVTFEYQGEAGNIVLNVTDSCYVPFIKVIGGEIEDDNTGSDVTENDYTDNYNFKDGSIIPTDTPGNVTVTSGKMTVACGPSNAYAYNGDHGVQFKTGNTITLAVLGDTTIEVGKCTYSQGTISLTKEDGTVIVAAQSMNGSCAKADETSVVTFEYQGEAGNIVLNVTDSCYVPFIKVIGGEIEDDTTGGEVDTTTYPVTLTLDSSIDLTGKNVTYNFTDANGTATSFTDASAIALKNGTYTLSLGGDFNQYAYEVSEETATVTVDGAAVAHSVAFSPITKWEFLTNFTANDGINKAVGYWKGLKVDATIDSANAGKLTPNGNSAQFNYATIYVPVTGSCTLTVTEYPNYGLYKVEGEDAAADSSEVLTYAYTGGADTLEITSYGKAYIKSIEVTYPEVKVTEMTFDVGDLDNAAKGSLAESQEIESGDFTLICHSNTAIEEKAVSFTDGYTSSKRLSLGGSLATNKAAIKFTTTAPAEVKVYWISGGDGREIKIMDESKNQKAITSEGSVKDTQYISTLTLEEAGTFLLGSSSSSNYIFKIVVTQTSGAKNPVVSTVTATQDANDTTGATVNVAFEGTAGDQGTNYVIEASKDDGANWIRVATSDGTKASATVEVDLTGEKFGFGTWKFRVRGENEVVAESTIVFAADTYTVTGTYNTGLDEADIAKVTGFVFEPVTDSIYEVPEVVLDTTAYTYTAVLEKGTTYAVSAVGVDEYSIINPASNIKYSEDIEMDIEFKKKVFYPITISLGSTPDLTGKELVYTFTHEDGAVYTFKNSEEIKLRDGNYSIAIGGDFEEYAYGINVGATISVNGAAVNHAITFRALTGWAFNNEFTKKIEGTTGYYKGLLIDATSGKIASNGDNCCAAVNSGTVIKVPVSGDCSITVTPHKGEAKYALYTINGTQASTTESSTTVEYKGEAGFIEIVATGTAYISGIGLLYSAKEVEVVEQDAMPFVPENDADANTAADTDGIPRQNKKENMVVQPVGQKLTFSQSGGKFADGFKDTADVTYYLFPKTDKASKLEFDLLVTESKATGNDAGFFGGLFTDNYVYSIGLRAGGTKIRGIYSKNGGIVGGSFAGAGSPAEELVGLNREIHYIITYDAENAKPKVDITFVDDAGELQTRSWSQGALAEPDGNVPTEFYYGFALANVSATITNMKYTDAEGKEVYYDQNACYKADGATPVASAVTMAVAESKEYIDINWTGTVPEGDGTYVVEMQKDGGEWVQLSEDVTGFAYRYTLPAGEAGNYKFRVCGQLGKAPLGGTRSDYAEMAEAQYVVAALAKPVVEISATATDITVDWNEIGGSDYYQVYRYSFDEGEEGILLVADRLVKTSFVDEEIEAETPYYYLVKAISEVGNNESPYSDLVWAVASAGHTGEYVYEDEATEIFITKKSYDTVFTDKAVLEGNVYGDGKLEAVVNGEVVASKEMANGDAFAFSLTVVPGRNDVNLLFTDEAGNVTRETFNFVYLTNYDIVVDASYTGTDGEAVNGIPTYKTVQAAVNAVPSNNSARKVILVMAGSYEERLEVKSPYITLIGEDRENTSIHCYPGKKDDMTTRCATYVYSSATAFSAENITFANDCVYAEHPEQADAIRVEPDNATFVNVGFKGVQDTLYMHSGKQYYYKCVIEGLIDFIYSGDAARAFFNDCEIVFVYEATKTSGYVSAPKTAENATYGLTFYNCVITSEEGCAGPGYLLARPWGPNAYITWINCYMGDVINETQPYNSMSGNMAEDARFFEFGSYGPGYEINVNRRQISPAKAEEMITTSFLGWDPASVVATISADSYVGDITTDREDQTQESERVDKHYAWTDGDDTGLKIYDMEGYAAAYEVTGGGLLKEGSEGYYEVDSAEEFLDALIASKNDGVDSVIELTADINLGCNEIENFADYKSVIKAYSAQPLTHPTLIETGVSQLSFDKIYNLTIFSSNGSSIKHANITMKNSENIIIRNVKFDELWEWDEATGGDYDRNDWDFMTIDSSSNGIWIDHCTFYKAYDGIVDIKNPSPIANVTISWCEFLPGSEGNVFFKEMMDEIYAHPENYPTTYQHMKEEGMTDAQIYMYAYAQKKTHLLGQSDDATSAAGIRLTLANNYYKDSMDRLPRLRYGKSHVYNCIMDSQAVRNVRLQLEATNPEMAKKLVSNGAISTCGGEMLLENCYINGIANAMNSGNSSSPAGYINAINSLYYMDGVATKLEPKNNNTLKDGTLVTDAPSFIANLPYADYELYDAADLYGIVKYNAGAGKLDLTTLQWEKTSYNAEWEDPEVQEEHPNVNSGSSDDSDDSDASEDTTIDWNEVQTEVKDTADAADSNTTAGTTTSQSANVNLNYTSTGETKVPTAVLDEIKGENVTVAFQSGNGVALSISGDKLKGVDLNKVGSVDLTVTNEPNVIPDLAVASKPAVAKKELSIKDTGNFGVAVDMHINVGKENAGKVANLYRYNPTSGKLEFCSHFVITAEGQSMFAIGRGGDYLITVTNTTVNETAWYFGGDYTVQAGDNLSAIAVRYHMPLAELIRRNPQLTNLNMIKPGQKLNLK